MLLETISFLLGRAVDTVSTGSLIFPLCAVVLAEQSIVFSAGNVSSGTFAKKFFPVPGGRCDGMARPFRVTSGTERTSGSSFFRTHTELSFISKETK